MKKRALAVILTVVLALSMTACAGSKYKEYETLINYLEKDDYQGAFVELVRLADEYKKNNEGIDNSVNNSTDSSGSNTDSGENKEDEVRRDWEGALIISKEEFLSYCEIVDITLDNWKDYFEDNLYVEHRVDKNNFGEITYEADESHYSFELKPEYKMVGLYNVAFKFDGRKYCDNVPRTRYFDDGEKEYQFREDLVNEKVSRYYSPEGDFVGEYAWYEYDYEQAVKDGYFYVEFWGSSRSASDWYSYTGYNCLGATGKLVIVNIPDELWTVTESFPEGKLSFEDSKGGTRNFPKDRNTLDSYFLKELFPDWEWED